MCCGSQLQWFTAGLNLLVRSVRPSWRMLRDWKLMAKTAVAAVKFSFVAKAVRVTTRTYVQVEASLNPHCSLVTLFIPAP